MMWVQDIRLSRGLLMWSKIREWRVPHESNPSVAVWTPPHLHLHHQYPLATTPLVHLRVMMVLQSYDFLLR